MGDVKATQYPDHVGPIHFNFVVPTSVAGTGTIPIADGSGIGILPWFVATKDTWLDDIRFVCHNPTLSAGATFTLKMAPSGTALGSGTTLLTTDEIHNIIPGETVIDKTSEAIILPTTGKISAIRIPAGYQVGWLVGGAPLAEGFSFSFTALQRQKAQ